MPLTLNNEVNWLLVQNILEYLIDLMKYVILFIFFSVPGIEHTTSWSVGTNTSPRSYIRSPFCEYFETRSH